VRKKKSRALAHAVMPGFPKIPHCKKLLTCFSLLLQWFCLFDVIAIGNATMDVFVHLAEKHLKQRRLCLVPGDKTEVDKIFFATGGGATNTAVGFSRFGLKTGILCALGKDENAKKIIEELKSEKVDCSGVVCLKKFKTAYSVILTGFGADRIILTFGGATTHLEKESQIGWKILEKTGFLYVSSFHSKPKLLKKIFLFAGKKNIPLAWNPGRSERQQGLKELMPLLEKTTILLQNEFEAKELAGAKSAKQSIVRLQKIVPIVVVTLGKKGSIAFDGKTFYRQKAHNVKVVDSTGCGDAFNSGFLSAVIRGRSIKQALALGTENAETELQHLGAKNKLLKRKI